MFGSVGFDCAGGVYCEVRFNPPLCLASVGGVVPSVTAEGVSFES